MDSTLFCESSIKVVDYISRKDVLSLTLSDQQPQNISDVCASLLEDGVYEFILKLSNSQIKLNPRLMIFDVELELSSIHGNEINYRPKRYGHSFEQIFQNFAGFCWFNVLLENDQVLYSLPFDVQIKTQSYLRLVEYLDVISQESPEYLYQKLSPIRWSAESTNGSTDQLIEALESALKIIELNLAHIISQPLSRIENTPNRQNCSYGQRPCLDTKKFCYSLMNSSVAELESNPSVLFQDIFKNTNISENVMIFNWISNVITFINANVDVEANEIYVPVASSVGYQSLFNYIKNKYSSIQKNRNLRLLNIKKQVEFHLWSFKEHFNNIDLYYQPFYLTQKALTTPFYRDIFLEMNKWYSKSYFSLSQSNFNYSMVRVDIIFEIFTWISIVKYLKQLLPHSIVSYGNIEYTDRFSRQKENKQTNYVSFQNGSERVDVYYEPSIFRHQDLSTSTLGITLSESKTLLRKPDFVIQFITKCAKYIMVLDAKYTSSEKAFMNRLPDLVMKYYHGFECGASEIISISTMSIDNNDYMPFIDFHKENIIPKLIIGNVSMSTKHMKGLDVLFKKICRMKSEIADVVNAKVIKKSGLTNGETDPAVVS